MTKAHLLARSGGRDHISDLDLRAAHNHPVDQQFHQLAALLEGRLGEPYPHPRRERFHAAQQPRQFVRLIDLRCKLL
jgi:hypothetical protein